MTNFEKEHLTTSVDLSYVEREKTPVYHFVYGSQLYETLFGIYAKFHFETSEKDESCLINKITLILFNYQGTINMGFTSHEPYYDGETNIYFGVKGGRKKYKKIISLKKSIVLRKGERHPLVFNRILYPLPGFEFNIDERNNRNTSDPLKADIPKTGIFDSEFQYRNGTDYYDRELRPGMLGFDGISIKILHERLPFPSPRCHHSNVSLIFQ